VTTIPPRPLTQSLRLLELVKVRPFTTLEARRMGIMNPAQRISELVAQGHPIETTRTLQTDDSGHTHQVALYVWNPNLKRQIELWPQT
jgi:hypothetical protein